MEWSVRAAAACGDIQLSSSRSDGAQTLFRRANTHHRTQRRCRDPVLAHTFGNSLDPLWASER